MMEEKNINRNEVLTVSENLFENIANKSVGKRLEPKRKHKIGKIICTASLATVLLATTLFVGAKVIIDIERVPKTERACLIVKEEATNVLLSNGLAYYDEENEFIVKNNEVADYSDILNLINPSMEELYAYFSIMSPNEFNKIVKSIKDENGNPVYENLSDFYVKNGFVDYNGKPYGNKFIYTSEAKLYEDLRSNNIHNIITSKSNDSIEKCATKNLVL